MPRSSRLYLSGVVLSRPPARNRFIKQTEGVCSDETYYMLPGGHLDGALGDGLCPIRSSNGAVDPQRFRHRSRLCRRPVLFLLARPRLRRRIRARIWRRILGESAWVLRNSLWALWSWVVSRGVWRRERTASPRRGTAATADGSGPCAAAIQEKILSTGLLQKSPRALFEHSLPSCRNRLLCDGKLVRPI